MMRVSSPSPVIPPTDIPKRTAVRTGSSDPPIGSWRCTVARLMGRRLPAAGGAYFRLLPYGLVRTGLRQATQDRTSGTFYIHPWELDDWMPDDDIPWLARFRTFAGRRRTWTRLERLLDEFAFGPVNGTVDAMIAEEESP